MTTNLLNEVGNLDRNSPGEGSILFNQELLRLAPVGTSSINELSKEDQIKITKQLSSEIKEVNNNLTNWDKNPESIVPGRKITYAEYFKEKEKTINYINERNLKITTAQAAFDLKKSVKETVLNNYYSKSDPIEVNITTLGFGNYNLKINPKYITTEGIPEKYLQNILEDNNLLLNDNPFLGSRGRTFLQTQLNNKLKSKVKNLNNEIDKELKKYTVSNMSIPLTLKGESTEKDPHSALKKATIGYIKGINRGFVDTDLQIDNFQPTSEGWKVNYSVKTNEKNPDGTSKTIVQKPLILSNDFVKQNQAYLKGFESNQLLNLIVAQKKFNQSNNENALNNKVITSPYLQLNGKTYKLAILPGDAEGTIRIGSPNEEGIIITDDLSEPMSFKQAWEFMNTPFKNKQTQSSIESISNKYLIQ